jgi:hypothetical protein
MRNGCAGRVGYRNVKPSRRGTDQVAAQLVPRTLWRVERHAALNPERERLGQRREAEADRNSTTRTVWASPALMQVTGRGANGRNFRRIGLFTWRAGFTRGIPGRALETVTAPYGRGSETMRSRTMRPRNLFFFDHRDRNLRGHVLMQPDRHLVLPELLDRVVQMHLAAVDREVLCGQGIDDIFRRD